MWNYELWRNAMYCVGVFVTCNVGGYLLIRIPEAVSAALMKRHGSAESVDEEARYWPVESVSGGKAADDRRRFDEIQRQTAHPDEADAAKGGGAS